jgi:hypothetical protein
MDGHGMLRYDSVTGASRDMLLGWLTTVSLRTRTASSWHWMDWSICITIHVGDARQVCAQQSGRCWYETGLNHLEPDPFSVFYYFSTFTGNITQEYYRASPLLLIKLVDENKQLRKQNERKRTKKKVLSFIAIWFQVGWTNNKWYNFPLKRSKREELSKGFWHETVLVIHDLIDKGNMGNAESHPGSTILDLDHPRDPMEDAPSSTTEKAANSSTYKPSVITTGGGSGVIPQIPTDALHNIASY